MNLERERRGEDLSRAEDKLNQVQSQLVANLRLENHEKFVPFDHDALGRSLESLVYAVQENIITVVQEIMLNNANLKDEIDSDGSTPIHTALKFGRVAIANLLLQPPVNLLQTDREGNTYLHLAAESKLDKIFKNLLPQYDENIIFERNIHGDNCIHLALLSGSNKIVNFIFNQFQNIDYDIRGYNNNSYLHYAAIGDCNEEILNLLISKSSDINCVNFFKQTPLHEALLNGCKRSARILCDSGANPTLIGIYRENCFHFAALGDCYTMIDYLSEMQIDINAKSLHGETPLHAALEASTITTIISLIKNGADVNCFDMDGNSIFHYVAERDLVKLFECLDTKSPLLYQQNKFGYTPLHLAVKYNSYFVFKILIQNRFNINRYCWKTKDTPLHTAAVLGNYSYVYELLLNKADPDATNKNGNTPIQLALQHKNTACVHIFLLYADNIHKHFCKEGYGVMHYATCCSPEIIVEIIATNENCRLDSLNNITNDTLYHSAIKNNNLEVVKYLVRQNVKQMANIDQITPLHMATDSGNAEIFKTLVDQLDIEDLKSTDKTGKSVLEYIISSGQKDILNKLKDRLTVLKKPLYLVQLKEKNVLHYAIKKGSLDIISTILSNEDIREEINKLDDDGFAPLHYAVEYGNLKAVNCLISFGSNINAVTCPENKTALHIAVINNHIKIVQFLIKNGVNVNVQDNLGYAAIHFAVVYQLEDILIYLIQNKASTELNTINDKYNPLLLATALDRPKMMEYLIECDENMKTVKDYIEKLRLLALSEECQNALKFITNYKGPNDNIVKLLSKNVGKDEIF